tara:strand:+ start:393 stop:638 length:246 start_codon:yes stop_codon:yes gene_type:complete
MKELFWMMIGICIGTIFHADIPVLNNISAAKIKMLVANATSAVTEDPPPPPTKKELRKDKRKGSFPKKNRKDKDIINSVEM